MASDKVFNVLFLCTHNSARSIMAEVIINYVGRGKFKGFSAGSHPRTAPNPFALATLRRLHFPTDGLYRWCTRRCRGVSSAQTSASDQ